MPSVSQIGHNLAQRVLDQLRKVGVREIVVCPGARNAAFIELLSESKDFKVVWHFEERSAAFYALGRVHASSNPVAVITTSGTASGELLPATMEAFYTSAPLMLVTSDRPRRFRGSGAPQAAEQPGIFGIYAPLAYDLEGEEDFDIQPGFGLPVHLNVCLEDPRGSAAQPSPEPHQTLQDFLDEVENPLVVVGGLAPNERPVVEAFLHAYQAPLYAESLSRMRNADFLKPWCLRVAEKVFERAIHAGAPFDGVLRIGSVPTHRLWRDLEDSRANLPVFSVSRLPFTGLGRTSGSQFGNLDEILNFTPEPVNVHSQLLPRDHELYARLSALLEAEPLSETGLFRRLSQAIPEGSPVFLGNSLPIREWDLAADYQRSFEASASRGLNGIDGQISTFLGLAAEKKGAWAILGDLTSLYDLAGPWPLGQIDLTATLVIVNNGGGKIFDRMFPNPHFQNNHGVSFGDWARGWNLEYELNPIHFSASEQGLKVIEVTPDAAATKRFWKAYGEILE